mmetsp:Transcript_2251/g.2606  ORF Transcript_2251/g.2606 Transcript_2251/m.2606 type:complete len:184 (+) Transcript_2251:181-732(+)
MILAFTTTTTTATKLLSRRTSPSVLGVMSTHHTSLSRSSSSRMYLSTHCQEAVGRLQEAFEHYRLTNYQQELPTRFKKEIIKECSLTGPSSTIGKKAVPASTMIATTTLAGSTVMNVVNNDTIANDQTIAVQEIEQLLRNIGAFGTNCGVTHDDVEIIVSEHSSTCTMNNNQIRADKILMRLL